MRASFYLCLSLTAKGVGLVLLQRLEEIGAYAFGACALIQHIAIPPSINRGKG